MKSKTWKIVLACFVGGVVCCGVALRVMPALWWLGLPAGFVGGYLSYEFRFVLRAVPKALRWAWRETRSAISARWEKSLNWLKQPPPVELFAVLIFSAAFIGLAVLNGLPIWSGDGSPVEIPLSGKITMMVLYAIFLGMFSMIVSLFSLFLAALLTLFGRLTVWAEHSGLSSAREEDRLFPLGYADFFRLLLYGLGAIPMALSWYLPYGVVWLVYHLVSLAVKTVWYFFRLIHSHERVLCGIDGALGGAISYLYLVPLAGDGLAETIVAVFFGGVFGAGIGVVNYRLVQGLWLSRYGKVTF